MILEFSLKDNERPNPLHAPRIYVELDTGLVTTRDTGHYIGTLADIAPNGNARVAMPEYIVEIAP